MLDWEGCPGTARLFTLSAIRVLISSKCHGRKSCRLFNSGIERGAFHLSAPPTSGCGRRRAPTPNQRIGYRAQAAQADAVVAAAKAAIENNRREKQLQQAKISSNERSSKGRAVAWPREDANHGDVHTSRPGGETRSLGIGGASETALRALQVFGQVNRMARSSHFYVDQKAVKMTYWPGMLEAGSA
jgi:hypothetical protein